MLQFGTVLNDMDAKSAIKAGARFLMSHAMVKDILDDIGEVLYIPGVMTPTKVLNAHNAGAQVVKFLVFELFGLHDADSIGASTVLLSDAIFEKDAMRKRNYDRIHELACREALQGKEIKCQIQNDVRSPLLGCKD
ncbi:hypothetical protein IFM89_002515 [Coptis chinensis]|uniref:Uncharacterized protein n=1 Tax=Coptis chinensis TaxID=261450 RepID=A0A835HKN0_9MAGN|nr:hypothetical protein IFM89_002515 [Coptis chinensis]